jgi:hypothetical protein
MQSTAMAQTPPTEYAVGKPYNESRRSWPETNQFLCRRGQFELLLFYNRPSESEVLQIRKAEVRFGLLPYREAIFLLYRFGDAGWSDAAFSWWLHPEGDRTLPMPAAEIMAETRILLHIMLIGADDGLIKAIRLVTLSNPFTAKLLEAVRKQASEPWPGDAKYTATIQAAYSLWPQSRQMASAAIARCSGGD